MINTYKKNKILIHLFPSITEFSSMSGKYELINSKNNIEKSYFANLNILWWYLRISVKYQNKHLKSQFTNILKYIVLLLLI